MFNPMKALREQLMQKSMSSLDERFKRARQATNDTTSSVASTSSAAAAPAPSFKIATARYPELRNWYNCCPHTGPADICESCGASIKAAKIQSAVAAGLPGGFNFATGGLDRDVAACNNACAHRGLNDCCEACLVSFMQRKTAEVNGLISVSNAAVGHLNGAAAASAGIASGMGGLRQSLVQQSAQREAQRQEMVRQQMMMHSRQGFVAGGYGGGGGTWGRQQQLANGMVWDPPVYAPYTAYDQFRY